MRPELLFRSVCGRIECPGVRDHRDIGRADRSGWCGSAGGLFPWAWLGRDPLPLRCLSSPSRYDLLHARCASRPGLYRGAAAAVPRRGPRARHPVARRVPCRSAGTRLRYRFPGWPRRSGGRGTAATFRTATGVGLRPVRARHLAIRCLWRWLALPYHAARAHIRPIFAARLSTEPVYRRSALFGGTSAPSLCSIGIIQGDAR